MIAFDLDQKIKYWAKEHGLPFEVMKALVIIESSGDTWANRYEGHWRWFFKPSYWSWRLRITNETERKNQAMSWGLCQVMGTVARELGLKDHIPSLCDPDVGLDFGCRKLKQEWEEHGSMQDALAAYNAGSPRRRAGQLYAQKILKKRDTIA